MKLWKEWLQWLKEHAGPNIYMVILLTGALGLRCGEALCLKGKDINLEAAIPKVTITGESQGGKTSPGDVYVRQQHVQLPRRILKHGIINTRCKKHKHGRGQSKSILIKESYVGPDSGYLFPSRKMLNGRSCTIMLCMTMFAGKLLNSSST